MTVRVLALLMVSPVLLAAQRLERQQSGTTARLQAVSVVSDRIVWASGTGGTWTRTTDGGATWRAGVVPGADSLEFRDVHAFDARRAVLLAAGPGDKSRIYHTADGGTTWSRSFTNTEPRAFYDCFDFTGSTGVVVSDEVAGIFPLQRTTDGGKSWSAWSPPGHRELAAIDGEGAFAASGTCLTMTADGAAWIVTAKGGRVLRFSPEGSSVVVAPVVRDAASAGPASIAFRAGGVGLLAGGDLARADEFLDNVAVTRDAGKTWQLTGRPTFTGSVYGLAWVASRPGTVVAVGPKGASWSADDGATWARLDDGDYWGIGFAPNGTGWLAGPRGAVLKVVF